MTKFLKKISTAIVIFVFAFSMLSATVAMAGNDNDVGGGTGWNTQVGGANNTLWDTRNNDIQARTSLGNDDPRNIAANIINLMLGFLGILAVVLILFGGFKWMTAAGNEDKVTEAKRLLVSGVIGLVIILAAYALAAFVLDAIFRVTTSGSNVGF
ncbi:hypothetical protein C0583_05855 [Candidatus Parcubacteria bacterium]|nr:MAG: hypothetical protein C0583_05855 [Candidatus Parcubacteria bacterium]